jgi:hypothetical protein
MSNIVELTAGNLAIRTAGYRRDVDIARGGVQDSQYLEQHHPREIIALRIIELARRGERTRAALEGHPLTECKGGSGC